MALDTAKATVILNKLLRVFDSSFNAQSPFYPSLCTVVPSDGADEVYGWLGSIPSVREWLGDRQFNELRASTYSLPNKQWEDSLLIPKNNLADDRFGMYSMVMPDLAQRAAQHPDKLLFQAMVAGATTLSADGQYFYDTDHSWGDSGTQSNLLTTTASTGTTPTVAEFQTSWTSVVSALIGFKDDSGEPLNQPVVGSYDNLMIICPKELRQTIHQAFDAAIISQTSNVVIDRPKIMVSPFLTDSTIYYTFNLDSFMKPFVFQAREPLSRQMKGLEDRETKDVKFMTDARYNIGYLAWWKAVSMQFT